MRLKAKIVASILAGFAGATACSKLSIGSLTDTNSVTFAKALDGYSFTSADLYSSSIQSYGGALDSWRYSNTGNGDTYGSVSLVNGVLNISRPNVTGPCDNSGTAPSCGFTWNSGTNGVYHGGDYNVFPNVPALSNEFQLLKYLQVDVHHELATGDLSTGMSDCGIAIGFGSSAGSPSAPLAANNFQIAGRTTNSDFVRLMHRYSGTTEQMLIDAPIQTATDNSFGEWGISTWANGFNMTSGSLPSQNGDYVDFRMAFTFDHVLHTATVVLTPLSTNKTFSAMHSQTIVWPYTAASNTTVGGEARAGITIGSGTHALSMSDLMQSRASVGFIANGVAKSCAYSNIQLTVLKTPE